MGNIKGWVNVHIDIETKKMFISNKPYSSKEESELGIFIGSCIEKVGCFEIEYTDIQDVVFNKGHEELSEWKNYKQL